MVEVLKSALISEEWDSEEVNSSKVEEGYLQVDAIEEVSLLGSAEVIVSDEADLGTNESLEFSTSKKGSQEIGWIFYSSVSSELVLNS